MRILIADDDDFCRKLLEDTLFGWGHEAVSCSDGAEAWERFQEEDAPKLAILDWMMPGLEGPEVCRKVRELPHAGGIYILLLTSLERKDKIVEGLEAGADDYVVKPFDRNEMKARIQVGQRIVELHERTLEAERDRVLAQTAGAAAHLINQPLTVILGNVELLMNWTASDDTARGFMDAIQKAGEQIDQIIRKMEAAHHYATTPYLMEEDIVDFDGGILEKGQEDEGLCGQKDK